MRKKLEAIGETIVKSIEQAQELQNPVLIYLLQMASLEVADMEAKQDQND